MNPNDLRSQSALDLPQEQLDEATFQEAWAEGREMSLEETLDYALHESIANEAS